jgi:hypothetical protein
MRTAGVPAGIVGRLLRVWWLMAAILSGRVARCDSVHGFYVFCCYGIDYW